MVITSTSLSVYFHINNITIGGMDPACGVGKCIDIEIVNTL